MPLDISAIYGAGQYQPLDVGALYAEAFKLRQLKQQQNEGNALRALVANPQNLDPTTGLPTQNALRGLMGIAPDKAMGLMEDEAKIGDERALAQERQQKGALERDNFVNKGVREPAAAAYDQAIRDGKTPDQAQDIAQKAYTDGLDEARRSGLFSDDEAAQFDPKFDIDRVRQRIKLNAAHNAAVKGSDIETLVDPATGVTYDHDKITGTNRTMGGQPYEPSDRAQKVGGANEAGSLDDEGVRYYAKLFRTQGPTALGRLSKPDRDKVINMAAGEAGGSADADIRTQRATKGAEAEQQSAGRRVGQLVVAEKEMEGAVEISRNAYRKLGRESGIFTPFNVLRNLAEKHTGSPEQAAAYAADNAIVNIYARMISPTGQGTDSDKNHAREMLNQAQSPEAHDAVLNQLMTEGRNAMQRGQEAQAQITSETPIADRDSPTNRQSPGGEHKGASGPRGRADAYLRAHNTPANRKFYDERYGEGAAEKALGGE